TWRARSSWPASIGAARGSSPSRRARSRRATMPPPSSRRTRSSSWRSSCNRSGITEVRVVISGAGAVGRHLASDLAKRGHSVTLIEQDPAVLEIARDWAPQVDHMLGDACEPWVLEKAQLNTAD